MAIKKKDISCPTCDKKHTWTPENEFKPFCSERCKLIDLGEWADEGRKIPGEPFTPGEPSSEDSE